MYAIMLPHKAWAAGDVLSAVFKLSPLMKGIVVQSIVSTLCETTKLYARGGVQEDSRVVLTARHDIINGKAVENDGMGGSNQSSPWKVFGSAANPSSTEAHQGLEERQDEDDYSNRDIVTFIKLKIPPSGHVLDTNGSLTPNSQPNSPVATSSGFPFTQISASELLLPSTTIVAPSHSLEPISISHRIRWSIYLKNRDGHISELRCSLPVVILDGRLLQESREISVPTRRLMLGSAGLGRVGDEWAIGDGEDGLSGAIGDTSGEDDEFLPPVEADRELPSYTAHVGDRVANMFLPEAVTIRVTNPWVGRVGTTANSPNETGQRSILEGGPSRPSNTAVGGEVTDSSDGDLPSSSSNPNSRPSYSGRNSNRNSVPNLYHNANQYTDTMGRAHLPYEPGLGEATPLDWVNSELLLSLSDEPIRRMERSAAANGVHSPGAAPPAPNYVAPGPGGSRWGSRVQSRMGSRAGSLERGADTGRRASLDEATPRGASSRPVSRPPSPPGTSSLAGQVMASTGYSFEALPSSGSSSPVQHGHSSMKNFFKATMKPFTALANRHTSDKGKVRESPPASEPNSVAHSPLVLSRQVSNSISSPNGQLDRTQSTSALVLQHQSWYSRIHPSGATSNPMNASSVADLARTASNVPVHLISRTGSSSSLQQAQDQHPHASISRLPSSLVDSMSSPGPIADVHQQHHRPSPLANRRELNSNASTSTSVLQASATSSAVTISGPALLHRALTEVPNYSIASRGFIGGVPPLSSMRGLPSYEEAARDSRRNVEVERAAPSSGSFCQPSRVCFLPERVDDSSAGHSTTTVTSSASEKSRRLGTLSDSDIVSRFIRTGMNAPHASEIVAAVSREEDEDSDNSEGIHMQTRKKRVP